eukprot:UN03472
MNTDFNKQEGPIFWSSTVLTQLAKNAENHDVTINILPNGQVHFVWEHMEELPRDCNVQFVNPGTLAQAKAYDLATVNATMAANYEIAKRDSTLQHHKMLIQQRINNVVQSYGPNIHPDAKAKADAVISKIESISFNPKLSSFWYYMCKRTSIIRSLLFS